VTEKRAPGPPARYCQHCSADPQLIRRRARERKAVQRRQGQDTSTTDATTPAESHTQTTAEVTELAGAVTKPSPVAESESTAAQPGQEELVISMLIPGQRRIAHYTASELQSSIGTSASNRVPADGAPTADTRPAAGSS